MTGEVNALAAQAGSLARAGDLQRAVDAGAQARNGKTDQAAKQFEELLATMLVRELRRGLPDGFFGAGAGSDVFEGWLDEHLGRSLARDGVFDLAQEVRVSLGASADVRAAAEDAEEAVE